MTGVVIIVVFVVAVGDWVLQIDQEGLIVEVEVGTESRGALRTLEGVSGGGKGVASIRRTLISVAVLARPVLS